jgi:hypothetical protein
VRLSADGEVQGVSLSDLGVYAVLELREGAE